MEISGLYIHPIKGLNPCPVQSATLTSTGLKYDRQMALANILADDKLEILHLGRESELCLFRVNLEPKEEPSRIKVVYSGNYADSNTSIYIPLENDTTALPQVDVVLYNSGTKAYKLGPHYDEFFSAHLGHQVIVLYLGDNQREILGSARWLDGPDNLTPSTSMSFLPGSFAFFSELVRPRAKNAGSTGVIGFADLAPFLIMTEESLEELNKGIEGTVKLDMMRFRPNIVLKGASAPWVEDYWQMLHVGQKKLKFRVTANCTRCTAVNVDYNTGLYLPAATQPLKKMMKDRRLDDGMRWSPCFGRYALCRDISERVSVGDKVTVAALNESRDKFYWPGLSTGKAISYESWMRGESADD